MLVSQLYRISYSFIWICSRAYDVTWPYLTPFLLTKDAKKVDHHKGRRERQMDRLTEGLNWKGAIRREPWRRRGDTTDAAKCAPGRTARMINGLRYWPWVTRTYTSLLISLNCATKAMIFGIQRWPVCWHSSEKAVALNSATVLIFQYWHLSLIFLFCLRKAYRYAIFPW